MIRGALDLSTIMSPLLFRPNALDLKRLVEILPPSCWHGLPEGQKAGLSEAAVLPHLVMPAAPCIS